MCWEALPVISATLQWEVHIYWSAGMKETDVWSWWCMKSALAVRCPCLYEINSCKRVRHGRRKMTFCIGYDSWPLSSVMILQVCIQSDKESQRSLAGLKWSNLWFKDDIMWKHKTIIKPCILLFVVIFEIPIKSESPAFMSFQWKV